MKLKRLTIGRLPGIDQPFEIESAGAGVHVIFGPNAIGKSSVCRAVESLYWDDRGPRERIFVTGQFELDGETWCAQRDGSRLRWRSGSEDRVPPSIPASHHHRCYFLRLRDLIDPSLEGTHDIASEIRRQMSGGFDLDGIVEALFPGVSIRRIRCQRDEFNAAARSVQDAEGRQLDIQHRADVLSALKKDLEAAEEAGCRLPFVDRALGLARRAEERAGVKDEIAALPRALANLTGQETEQVEWLRARMDELDERARALQSERSNAHDAKRDSRLPAEVNRSDLVVWREHANELVRLELKLQEEKMHRGECRKKLEAALSALGGRRRGRGCFHRRGPRPFVQVPACRRGPPNAEESHRIEIASSREYRSRRGCSRPSRESSGGHRRAAPVAACARARNAPGQASGAALVDSARRGDGGRRGRVGGLRRSSGSDGCWRQAWGSWRR